MNSKPAKKQKNRPKGLEYVPERNMLVMWKLWKYLIARQSTLHRRCFPNVKNEKSVQDSLRLMVKKEFIDVAFTDVVHRGRRRSQDQKQRNVMYWILDKGMNRLYEEGVLPDIDSLAVKDRFRYIQNLTDPDEVKRRTPNYLNHRLDISAVRACLELAVASLEGVFLYWWIDEYDKNEEGEFYLHDEATVVYAPRSKPQRKAIRPDACFVLQEKETGKQALFFVEVDEGNEAGASVWKENKVLPYCAYFIQGFQQRYKRFSHDGFRVLTITRSRSGKEQDRRKRTLINATFNAGEKKKKNQFWFATFDEVMPGSIVTGNHILTSPIWQRAGGDRLSDCPRLCLSDHLFNRSQRQANFQPEELEASN